jgi:hypothetical protein
MNYEKSRYGGFLSGVDGVEMRIVLEEKVVSKYQSTTKQCFVMNL